MRTKTQLALIRTLQARRRATTSAFTLVELMIVVAVIGILSAVALPQYLQARNSAQAGSRVGEIIGLGKECATFAASGGIGVAPATAASVTVVCASTGGSVSGTWASGPVGIRCLDQTSVAANKAAKVTIDASGGLTCAFSS